MLIETNPRGYIVVDSPRGNDETAQRDSWTHPYASLSRALQFVQNNDTVLVYPGPYMETPQEPLYEVYELPGLGAALHLQNLSGVTIRGIGRPVVWFTTHGNGLALENCTDIRIEGLHFRGAGQLMESQPYLFALLLLHGSNDRIQVRDCIFSESGNHGIGHLVGPRGTDNSVFENNQFLTGGHLRQPYLVADGAAIAVGGSDNRICGNHIRDWLRGIELESSVPDSTTSRNVVSGNRIYRCLWQSILVVPEHQNPDLFDQIIISDNIIQGTGCSTSPGFIQEGISVWGGQNMRLSGNTIQDMFNGLGIHVHTDKAPVHNVIISENLIKNVDRTGIHVARTTFPARSTVFPLSACQVHHNVVGPVGGRGIWIEGDYNSIDFNHIRDCGVETVWEGLYLAGGSHNAFRFNMLTDSPMSLLGQETIESGNDIHYLNRDPSNPKFTSVSRAGDEMVMSWPAGQLEMSDTAAGPWGPVPYAANPHVVPLTETQKFFRLRPTSQ
jgi:hypothetical protein